MKRIPYGISDYKKLKLENYIFVDKTKYIEKLENYHSPYIFFLRPRRFGKSLFTSMLSHYYDYNQKNNFEELFGDSYIGKNKTKDANGYYILKFNFSTLNTDSKEILQNNFLISIKESFDSFIREYNLSLEYMRDYDDPATILNNFLAIVYDKIDKPIYVIIDEYDHFANELLSFKPELFKDLVSKTGYVRKFYEALKKGTEFIVGKIFATGVSPITLDSMTSGFNIGDNLTRNELFHEMMGFTDLEVRDLIKTTVKKEISQEELDRVMIILTQNYNGYLFSERASIRLFNSDMILYYLKYYVETGIGPKNLIDENIASDYNKIGNLFTLTTKGASTKIIDKILRGEELVGEITSQFSLEKEFNEEDFLSLLFYLGFLTIDKEDFADVIYKVPNEAVKGIYFDYFAKKLEEESDYEMDIVEIKKADKNIAVNGNIKSLVEVIEKALNKLSNRDFINFDEKYIKIIMISYLNLARVYLIKSEYEVEEGYIDIALLNNYIVKPRYYGIIELKYVTKKEYEKSGQNIIDYKKEEAIIQINNYKTSEELLAFTELKKWVLVFVKDKCVVNLEIE